MNVERLGRGAAWGLFFFSGCTGLIYEVLWTRSLTLVFGNTVYAASTVLAAYMGGLALGAWLLGRAADRSGRPLLLYAVLEAAVGFSALLFPVLLQMSVPVLQWLYRGGHGGLLAAVRFALAFGYLLIPTAAMGGTLPVLARLMTRAETSGRTLSWLYGINTAGAVAGTVWSGFWLLPGLGLSGTRNLAVGLNAAIALVAAVVGWRLVRSPSGASAGRPVPLPAEEGEPEGGRFATPVVLAAYLLSGAFALALEVLWTRSLLLVFGSTVYSFATMLALFLAGLALGSALMGAVVQRFPNPLLALGLVEGGVGLVTLVSIARFNGLPSTFLDALIRHGLNWSSYLSAKILIAGGVLLPVALLFGATFPLVARLQVRRASRVGGDVGLLYASNTLGAILGSVLAGFVLLPAWGLQRSLSLVALSALGLGTVLAVLRRPGERLLPRAAFSALLLAAGVVSAAVAKPWDEKLLSAGVYFRPTDYMTPDRRGNQLDQALGNIQLLRYAEGLTETAAVVETPVGRRFLVDGKIEATTHFVDMRLQRLMGHLPMLFARRAERAVNIGLGCGITLGALKVHPLAELTCVELERNILATARYFSGPNHQVLDDPRLHVVLNDGRNHLLLTDARYDVITSDPFKPLVGGAAALYTYDHFANGRKRLRPGGIFCQYLPMYQLSPDDFRMIIRSFCRVYPHTSLWYTGQDTILLGSEEPHRVTLAVLRERMAEPGVRASLAEAGIATPEQLLQTFVMEPGRQGGLREGELNTDENPRIEFSAPKSHLANTTPPNLAWCLENYHPEGLPLDLDGDEARGVAEKARKVGLLSMKGSLARFQGRQGDALGALREALALDPENVEVLYSLNAAANTAANELLDQGRLDEAHALLEEALATGQQPVDTYVNLAGWAYRAGRPAEALEWLRKAEALAPLVPDYPLKAALALQELGRLDEAREACARALRLNPKYAQARLTEAGLRFAQGDKAGARSLLEEVLASHPEVAVAQDWTLLGALRADAGEVGEAARAFQAAVERAPSDPRAWYALARFQRQTGDGAASAASLERARRLAPQAVEEWMGRDPLFAGGSGKSP